VNSGAPEIGESKKRDGGESVSNKSPAFQWYPKDILASARVQEMSLAEEGAYRRLLDFCWLGGSIPADEKRCARLIGKGATPEIAKVCLEMFSPHPEDESKMIHDRLEVERAKQESNSKARQQAAKARWKKPGKPQKERGKQETPTVDANALQMQSIPIATASTTISSSDEKEIGGGKTPPTAHSPPNAQESLAEYLDRKQLEFPHLNVETIWADFADKCGSERYPKMRATRPRFDKWLADQWEEEKEAADLTVVYVNPATGKALK
jgi:uncharacterized protein YdaU (DUF1376 family)